MCSCCCSFSPKGGCTEFGGVSLEEKDEVLVLDSSLLFVSFFSLVCSFGYWNAGIIDDGVFTCLGSSCVLCYVFLPCRGVVLVLLPVRLKTKLMIVLC